MAAVPTLPKPLTTALLLLASLFLLIAALFLFVPLRGAEMFGLGAREPAALFFVRAVGLRDLALALYVAGLTHAGTPRSLAIVLAATTVIPIGDITMLLLAGTGTPLHYLLHGASLACFAGTAAWTSNCHRSVTAE